MSTIISLQSTCVPRLPQHLSWFLRKIFSFPKYLSNFRKTLLHLIVLLGYGPLLTDLQTVLFIFGAGVQGTIWRIHFVIYFYLFLWPHQQHMGVAGPGIESQLQRWPMLQLWQSQILNSLCKGQGWKLQLRRNNIGSLTCWAIMGIPTLVFELSF